MPKIPKQQSNQNSENYGFSGDIGRRTLDLNEMLLSPKVKGHNDFGIPQFGGLNLIKAESMEESQDCEENLKHDAQIQAGSPKI